MPRRSGESHATTTEEVTRCICGNEVFVSTSRTRALNASPGLYVQCERCQVWQHGFCMGFVSENSVPDIYYCELCEPAFHRLHQRSGMLMSRYRPHGIPSKDDDDKASSIEDNSSDSNSIEDKDSISNKVKLKEKGKRTSNGSRNQRNDDDSIDEIDKINKSQKTHKVNKAQKSPRDDDQTSDEDTQDKSENSDSSHSSDKSKHSKHSIHTPHDKAVSHSDRRSPEFTKTKVKSESETPRSRSSSSSKLPDLDISLPEISASLTDSEDSRDSKEPREPREPKGAKELKESKELKAMKDENEDNSEEVGNAVDQQASETSSTLESPETEIPDASTGSAPKSRRGTDEGLNSEKDERKRKGRKNSDSEFLRNNRTRRFRESEILQMVLEESAREAKEAERQKRRSEGLELSDENGGEKASEVEDTPTKYEARESVDSGERKRKAQEATEPKRRRAQPRTRGARRGPKPRQMRNTEKPETIKKCKPKIPSSRSTITEMIRRVANILDFSSRAQADLSNEGHADFVALKSAASSPQLSTQVADLERVYERNIASLEGLTKKLLDWEERYNKSENVENGR